MLVVESQGERLRRLRRGQALTQQELAEKAGVSAATIIRFENNEREPQVRTLKKLAAALAVDPRELVGD